MPDAKPVNEYEMRLAEIPEEVRRRWMYGTYEPSFNPDDDEEEDRDRSYYERDEDDDDYL